MNAQPPVLLQGQVNEYKIRFIAFQVLLSTILYLWKGWGIVPVLLVIDFGLRSFDLGAYSPFARMGEQWVRWTKLGVKPIFYPPKRFAARIGLGFSVAIFVLHLLGINPTALGAILAFFAALESLAGFCAGCYVYNWVQPLIQKWTDKD